MRRLVLHAATMFLFICASRQADACKVKQQRKVARNVVPATPAPPIEQATPAPETPAPAKAESTPTEKTEAPKAEPTPTAVATKTPVEDKAARPQEEKSEAPPEPAPPAKNGKAGYHDTIRFTVGSGLNPSAKKSLDELARWMQANPDAKITVEGHCDTTGSPEFNQKLGERRADAVKSYLEGAGVEGGRIDTVSLGDTKPKFAPTDRRNRRASIVKQ